MAEGATGHNSGSRGSGGSSSSGPGSGSDTALSSDIDGSEAAGGISAKPAEVRGANVVPSILDSMPAPPSLDEDSLGLVSLLLS